MEIQKNKPSISTWEKVLRTSLKNQKELESFFECPFPEINYPIRIPLRVAKKIKDLGFDHPLALQYLPHRDENLSQGSLDPIGDQKFQHGKIIHRYNNRLLVIPTSTCPVICRYCFRKNELYDGTFVDRDSLERIKNYLIDHPEVEEVIFSGGDPFILSTSVLRKYTDIIKEIDSVKNIRFHTRTFITIPERMDIELLDYLEGIISHFENVTIIHHINHVSELDEDILDVLSKMRRLPLHQFSQSVLLKNVNDTSKDLIELFKSLAKVGCIPYYLHHPDNAKGTQHFSLSLEQGRKIYHSLRNQLPGWMIPQYILDIPEGEGKVPAFNPEGFKSSGKFINKSSELVDTQIF
ncbi:MAG: radical SAM protein [Oligoflexia bacterium]|nr:radical SAM protein [Oligoflexia bacterium]